MNFAPQNIKLFLDSVDLVLNSNTFLLETTADFDSIAQTRIDISEFMALGGFKSQLLEQDLIRDWTNYYSLNDHGEYTLTANGELVKPDFQIELTEVSQEAAFHRLRAMLTVEPNSYNFRSPYHQEMEREKATTLVRNFLNSLMLALNWKAYLLNTDFCYSRVEQDQNPNVTAYFEGDYGADSATLLVREDGKSYLLLTNGID